MALDVWAAPRRMDLYKCFKAAPSYGKEPETQTPVSAFSKHFCYWSAWCHESCVAHRFQRYLGPFCNFLLLHLMPKMWIAAKYVFLCCLQCKDKWMCIYFFKKSKQSMSRMKYLLANLCKNCTKKMLTFHMALVNFCTLTKKTFEQKLVWHYNILWKIYLKYWNKHSCSFEYKQCKEVKPKDFIYLWNSLHTSVHVIMMPWKLYTFYSDLIVNM